jgi:CTP-dependent riboflavin kinase
MRRETIIGELATGLGEAAGFTGLDWARAAFREHLGIEAWPGTLNLVVRSGEDRAAWAAVKGWPGIILPPPRPDWCRSRCWRARIDGRIDAAIVLPEIESYPDDKIELIAAVAVRAALNLADGDAVRIEVMAE